MSKLEKCLEQLGITGADATNMLGMVEEGMSEHRAVRQHLRALDEEIAELAGQIENAGGAVARRGPPTTLDQSQESAEQEDLEWSGWQPARTKGGVIRGAPKWVNDRADKDAALDEMLDHLVERIKEGLSGRYWYEESARSVLRLMQGDVVAAEQFIQLLAIYSPQANVQVNTTFALKAWNQWKNGEPISVKTKEQDRKAKELLYDGVAFDGRKTNSFYLNLMHDLLDQNPGAIEQLQLDKDLVEDINKPVTIDMWMYRAFGYENESAGDDKGTGAYSFAENITRSITARLNQNLPEGGDRWTPHQVQSAIWTAMKARYEIAEVKEATWAESIEAGLAFIGEDNKRHVPGDVEGKRAHNKIWYKHAMAVTSEDATASAEETGASFKDFLDQLVETVTWEALPSKSLGLELFNASPEVKAEFTRRAAELLLTEDGADALAEQLGVPIAFIRSGLGGYEGNVNPNNLSHLVPTKSAGGFSRDEIRAYARAIQYIFRQDAVPWFRADARALLSKAAQAEQKFRVTKTSPGTKDTVSTYDTQAEAQAAQAEKEAAVLAEIARTEALIEKRAGQIARQQDPEKRAKTEAQQVKSRAKLDVLRSTEFSLTGGKYARAVALRFDHNLDVKETQQVLDLLERVFGEGAGFTRTAPNEISMINFRDDATGVPFVDDEQFLAGVDQFVEENQDALGLNDIGDFWSEGEYGNVHNWSEDSQGQALEAAIAAGGRSDLLAWVRGRRAALDRLLEDYTGDQLQLREQEARAAEQLYQEPAGQDRGRGGDRGSRFPVRADGTVPLTHWGRIPGLTNLDPAYHGQGAAGLEKRRAGVDFLPRTYFGLPGYNIQGDPGVRQGAQTAYYTSIPLNQLYDLREDPDGLHDQILARKEAEKKYPGLVVHVTKSDMENAIRDAGYKGYLSDHPQIGPVAAVFEVTDVAEIGNVDNPVWGDVAPFDTSFGHEVVSADQLQGADQAHAPEHATRFLEETVRGDRSPRRPPSVRAEADGSYTVLDGRSGTTAALGMGFSQIPVRVIDRDTGHRLEDDAAQEQLEAQFEAAARHKDKFDKKVEQIAGQFAGYPLTTVLKGREKTVNKVNNDYDGDPTRMKDILRATVVVGSVNDVQAALAQVQEQFKVVGKVRNLFENDIWDNAYQDIKVNVEMDGSVYEIQINTFENIVAKEAYAHNFYDAQVKLAHKYAAEMDVSDYSARDQEIYAALDLAQAALYRYTKKAHRDGVPFEEVAKQLPVIASREADKLAQYGLSFKDMNSSFEIGAPFLKAVARLYGRGGFTSYRTAEPSGETATAIPSTSRKREPSGKSDISITSRQSLSQNQDVLEQSAYHGGPSIFDRFSTEHIGTGEGAQAYGWGLYFASRREVAEWYRENLAEKQITLNGELVEDEVLAEAILDFDAVLRTTDNNFRMAQDEMLDRLRQRIKFMEDSLRIYDRDGIPATDERRIVDEQHRDQLRNAHRVIEDMRSADWDSQPAGRTYHVELAPEEDEYLLWDKPLVQQSEKVQEAIRSLGLKETDRDLSGALIYRALVRRPASEERARTTGHLIAGDRQASLDLLAAGVRGIKYLDGASRAGGRTVPPLFSLKLSKPRRDYNYVIFSDNDVEIREFWQEREGRGPQGAYQPLADGNLIKLFQSADLSTFMHESAHLFLQLELGGRETADTQKILDWLGAKSVDEVLVRPGEGITPEKRAMHERWARGFEAYLFEGRAPSAELRPLFARMAEWLKQIYKDLGAFLGNYDVELNDEIRGVFDRLLATDEQIAQAEAQNSYAQDFFTDIQSAGMTAAEYDDYLRRKRKATDTANETLQTKLLKQLKRRTTKEWNRELKEETARAAEDLLDEPVYAAQAFFRGAKTEDHNNRLNTDSVKEAFDGKIPQALKGMTHKDSEVSIDNAATRFGYKSGYEMAKDIIESPSRLDAAKAQAEQTMVQRHGDILNDGTLEREAQEAAHNEERGKLILQELRALNRQTGLRTIDRKALKAHAEALVARTPLNELRPDRFHRAEVRAAQRAAQALSAGNVQEAHQAKLQQAANFYLWRAANEARTKRDNIRRQLKAMQDRKYKPNQVAPEYIRKLKVYLATFDFRQSVQEDRKEAAARLLRVANWIKQQTTDTREIQVLDDQLTQVLQAENDGSLDSFTIMNYRQMTLAQLEAVRDQAKHLRYVGGQLADAKKAVFNERMAHLASVLMDNFKGRKKPPKGSLREAFLGNLKEYGANILLHAETVVRYLDRFQDQGHFYQAIKRPIDDAVTQVMLPMQEKAGNDLSALYSEHYTDKELTANNRQQDLGFRTMSKWEMISLALNWGNESSRAAVLASVRDGEIEFTEATVAQILDKLDKRDWDFVQAVWDYIETYKQQLFELERRRHGIVPPVVQAQAVETKYGSYRGGYYPLKYDPGGAFKVTEEEANEMIKSITIGRFAHAKPKDGMLQARVGSGGRPVWLDMMVLHRHINDVITMISLAEPVTEVQSVLASDTISKAMDATGNTELLRSLDTWLKDTAAGEIMSSDFVSRMARAVRTGFSASKLGWNFGTMLVQPLGVFQSMPVIGYGNMMRGIVQLLRNPVGKGSVIYEVQRRSKFMHERAATFNKDIRDTLDKMRGNPNKPGFWPDWMRQSLFAGIIFTQRYVDVSTWLGAYEKAKAEGVTSEADLINAADRAVARTQASGIWSDRTPIERGSRSSQKRQDELLRMWTALASYFFAKGNVAVELTLKTNFASPKQAFQYVVDMMSLFVIEAIIVGLMRGTWPDDDDDESKAAWIAKEGALTVMATVPFVREFGSEVSGFRGGSTYGQFIKEVGEAVKQVEQGEADMALAKAFNDVGGIMFKYPSSATNRVVDSLVKDIQSEPVEPIDYLIWREK